MHEVEIYYDAIDKARVVRAKELSDIAQNFRSYNGVGSPNTFSKAAIVLSYANWEGFYNECVGEYVNFLTSRGKKTIDTDWNLLLGILDRDFESLRSRNHSADAKQQFITNLKLHVESDMTNFNLLIVQARSNLNFERLTQNFWTLNLDLRSLQKSRIRIDKELVGWRHSVAHGDNPDLSTMTIHEHINFVSSLLVDLADIFQYAMQSRS